MQSTSPYIPLAQAQSHGHTWLQDRLGNVVFVYWLDYCQLTFSGFITEQNKKNRYWGQPALPYTVLCLWLPKYQSTSCFPQINVPSPFQGDNLKFCAVTPVIPAASSGPNTALMLKLFSHPPPPLNTPYTQWQARNR